MHTKAVSVRLVAPLLLTMCSTLMAADEDRILFEFGKPDAAKQWQTVNDGVMGGLSDGQFKISIEKTMEFFGTLSLENGGGFASVRSSPREANLKTGDSIAARVRGDGREYSMNLYVPRDSGGYSFRQSFKTKKNEWIEVSFPMDKFVATYRGRLFSNEKLDPSKVNSVGFLLGDKKAGRFKLEVEWIKVEPASDAAYSNVSCEGTYPRHLQGVCVDDKAVYWSFTTQLVKTDLRGKLLKNVPVADHHGDLCFHDGKLNVAVNLGKFNDPEGNADSWIYSYDANDLSLITKHETQEVFHGAGGIGFMNDHFFVVGGLPDGVEENYVYEYDGEFQFMKKHIIKSGHTHLGIQTGTFADDHWWFGCYGDPKILLVTDAEFNMKGRYEFDCSLGIVGLPDGRLLSASGRCDKENGCTGTVRLVVPNEKSGFEFCEKE